MASITKRRIKRLLFIGPTGVGKSTLINILFNDSVRKSSLFKPAGISEGSKGSTNRFTTFYNFPDYAFTDSIGFGDDRFNQQNIFSMLEAIVKNSMVGYNKIYLCFKYGRISSEIRRDMNLLTEIFGNKMLEWCTIIFTHCNDQKMTKEKYIESNKHDTYIIDIINKVQNVIFGDNMTDADEEMENILIKRRQCLLDSLKQDIENSNIVYYSPPPRNLTEWLYAIFSAIRLRYRNDLTCFEEIQKISDAVENLMVHQNFAHYYGQCSICFDDMWHSSTVFTKCGHIYHETCINAWLDSRANNCPMCRSPLKKKDLCLTSLYSDNNGSTVTEEEEEEECITRL
jgi:GTP-binding protein EngB required for normal cell division